MTLLIKSTPENRKLVFNAIKAKILKHLEELEKKEGAELKKTFSELTGLLLKGGKGLPVGTIREWKGKKFIKIAQGKWRPKYDSVTRGAKLAISALKKKIELCEDEREMMALVLENRDRFSDKNGNPLPFVQQLSEFISQTQDKKAGKNTEKKTKGNEQPEGSGGNDGGVSPDDFNGKTSEAISFLLKRKEGKAKNALYHKDIGYIDIVYGKEGTAKSDGYGLAKIAKFHPEVLDNLQEIISSMTIVGKTKNRIQLESKKHKASIRLDWNGESKKWLLTAFEKESDVSDSRTDIAGTDNSRKNDTATPTNIASISIPQSEKKSSGKSEDEIKKLLEELNPDDGYPEKDYPEYKGKGQEAVDFIVQQKGGQVRGAFNRPDIGDIDVVWGKITDKEKHTGYGLSHIIDKHGMDAARVIGEVIEYGKVVKPTQGRTSIQLGYWKVALKQQFNGNKKIWIVTSFKNEDRGQITTPSPQSDYTKGTNSETSTTSIPQSGEKSSNNLSKSIVWLQNYLSKNGQKEEGAIEALRKQLEKVGR